MLCYDAFALCDLYRPAYIDSVNAYAHEKYESYVRIH